MEHQQVFPWYSGSENEKGPLLRGGSGDDSRVTSVRCLIIVARDAEDLWFYLTRTYGKIKGLQVLVDRRERERRQQAQPYAPERRQAERRRPPTVERNLRRQPFLFVPQ
jgi:hypothetical protein